MTALFLLSVLLAVGCSEAVQCYQCNAYDPGEPCADPFNSRGPGISTCSGPYCLRFKVIRKITQVMQQGTVQRRSILRTLRLGTPKSNPVNSTLAAQAVMQDDEDYFEIRRDCAEDGDVPPVSDHCSCDIVFKGETIKLCACKGELCNSAPFSESGESIPTVQPPNLCTSPPSNSSDITSSRNAAAPVFIHALLATSAAVVLQVIGSEKHI